MKKIIILITLIAVSAVTFGSTYSDGTYRGNFIDRDSNYNGEVQVNVQFDLENDIVKKASMRMLNFKGQNYMKDPKLKKEKEKYVSALNHLVGKNLEETMPDLYTPENIPMAGATVRGGKIRSAVQDGLNRGVYRLPKN
ncbi:hypothetical protein NRK67_02065 [Fusobacteria bacterium ZRK30]|nr:hypothetical protein NRK67_02065 [Fusobacteria bacterium ZRK30]